MILNDPAVAIVKELGMRALNMVKVWFEYEKVEQNLSVALGSRNTNPLQMAQGLPTFANDGVSCMMPT